MSTEISLAELQAAINVPHDEERSDVWDLLIKTGNWLEAAFGRRAANDALTAIFLDCVADHRNDASPDQPWTNDEPLWRRDLYNAALLNYLEDGTFKSVEDYFSLWDWRDLWKQSDYWESGFGEQILDRFFQLLHVYGSGGLALDWEGQPTLHLTNEAKRKLIEQQMQRGKRLLELLPSNWSKTAAVQRLVVTAIARFKLDFLQDLTPEEVAQLGGVDLKTVKNAISQRDERGLSVNEHGLIPVHLAARWLIRCRGFQPSIWLQVTDIDLQSAQSHENPSVEYVFVPVAQDDTSFLPHCRQGKYRVGPKGSEQIFDSYYEALDRLIRMPTPYWRRPNTHGNLGIVKGITWKRVPKTEIDRDVELSEGAA